MREPVVFFLILVIFFLYFFVIPLDIICSLLVVLLKQFNGLKIKIVKNQQKLFTIKFIFKMKNLINKFDNS
jgi:hypothetical protein